MCRPHSRCEWDQRQRKATDHLAGWDLQTRYGPARQNTAANKYEWRQDKGKKEENACNRNSGGEIQVRGDMIPPTRDWRHHEGCVCESTEDEHQCQSCDIPPPRKPTNRRSRWISNDIHARRNRYQADVVVRAGANTIETKRAVKIPGFARQIEVHFATAPMTVAAQTISGLATGANLLLGYILTALLLLFRLGYIASGTIELSNDEAYQWLWSKHLALSYFSKPPGIAFLQFAGTALWGDTQFGVRFFSPVFAAILSIVVLRFMAREIGARQGFLLLLIITSAPLLSVGAILMTIDPPLVLCCTLAMIAGWSAVQPGGTTKQWLLAGLADGLGFLYKYSGAYLLVCWALFFLFWTPAPAVLPMYWLMVIYWDARWREGVLAVKS